MSKNDKLVRKILLGQQVSYEDAEKLLLSLGFAMKSEVVSSCVSKERVS